MSTECFYIFNSFSPAWQPHKAQARFLLLEPLPLGKTSLNSGSSVAVSPLLWPAPSLSLLYMYWIKMDDIYIILININSHLNLSKLFTCSSQVTTWSSKPLERSNHFTKLWEFLWHTGPHLDRICMTKIWEEQAGALHRWMAEENA